MKSYKITEDFFLNEMLVKVEKEEKQEVKLAPKHQYIIIDRSGSMWRDLDSVIDTIVKYTEKLPEGSKVSLGYFSGYGEYGLSVPYELQKEKDGVVKTMNSYRTTLGCTNFTEILDKIKNDCKGRQASLFFFTDGCHNCGAFSQVIEILNELKQYLEVCVFVGCGYINRENMTDMAKVSEGSFIHLQGFNEFEQTLNNFGESIEECVPGALVDLPIDSENICSILGKNIVHYTKKNNQVFYKASNKSKQVLYFTSTSPAYPVEEISNKDEVCARTLIYTLVQNNLVPKALQVLNKVGDKYFIRKLYNTFTQEEYGLIEAELLKSIFDSRKRYREGRVENYLPKDDAFCVLDALDILANDDKVKIHLNDPEFVYNHISRKTQQTDGSKLEYPKDIQAFANNLKYHESRLNVNLNVRYRAFVPLQPQEFKETNAINESLSNYGLDEQSKYPVDCIRNYNIIADGKLNTIKLILSGLTKRTISKLSEYLTLRDDKKYVLDLSNITLINKSYLKTTSATVLAERCWQANLLSTELSVLKYLEKMANTSNITEDDDTDLLKFLSENYYIRNGSYEPPKTQVEATDEYPSYEFIVSFKDYSKAQASAVIKKIKAAKTLTNREKIVEFYYNKHKDLELDKIHEMITKINTEYKKIQAEIQHAKFAIILINRGCMDEFRSREDMVLTIDTTKFDTNINSVETRFQVIQKSVKI